MSRESFLFVAFSNNWIDYLTNGAELRHFSSILIDANMVRIAAIYERESLMIHCCDIILCQALFRTQQSDCNTNLILFFS
jgi:hypothetical protein